MTIEKLERDESQALPSDLDYTTLPSLSGELAQKLESVRPESLAQAARIEGMTPAALTVLHAASKKASFNKVKKVGW
jgi:tRNA uridine 5-carboxymethylaminomethyl modification enzyme